MQPMKEYFEFEDQPLNKTKKTIIEQINTKTKKEKEPVEKPQKEGIETHNTKDKPREK